MAYAPLKSVMAQAALLTADQFEQARRNWRLNVESGKEEPLLTALQRECGLPEEQFLERLATVLGLRFLPRLEVSKDKDLNRDLYGKVSTKVAFQYTVIPIGRDNGRLELAVCNPFDTGMLSAIQFDAPDEICLVLAPREQIEKALKNAYGVGAEAIGEMAENEVMDIEITTDKEIAGTDQDASVIKFVNQVIYEAWKDRATDIHFEPMETQLRIRYRIDGMLYAAPVPELKRFQSAIISRVKVMAGMNIAEKRLPQDGRINVRIKGNELDIRVSTVPTVYGESTSLRLLTREKKTITLETLGFPDRERNAIEKIIGKPHGIMLVTGPTGSGKSTSLYAALQRILERTGETKRILTVEEPVEYEIAGINQIPVRPEIGLTFAVGLRHILRQDPNIVMVGEIRDLETAEIAIRAALTGHLVLSTLHTNDAPSAFTRLIDMGIEPFLVASSVEAVMAQRLVRTICKDCKGDAPMNRDYLVKVGFPVEWIEDTKFWRGGVKPCDACRNLGYQGRTCIVELLVVTEALRPLIMNRAPATVIAQKAMEEGMDTLRMSGWKKVREGKTTIEEVLRVTQIEQHLAALMEESRK